MKKGRCLWYFKNIKEDCKTQTFLNFTLRPTLKLFMEELKYWRLNSLLPSNGVG